MSPRSRLKLGLLAATIVTLLVFLVATDVEAKSGLRSALKQMGREFVLPNPGSRYPSSKYGAVTDFEPFMSREIRDPPDPHPLYDTPLDRPPISTVPSLEFQLQILVPKAVQRHPEEAPLPESPAPQKHIETNDPLRTGPDLIERHLAPNVAVPKTSANPSQFGYSLFYGLSFAEAKFLRARIAADPLLRKIRFQSMRVPSVMNLQQVLQAIALMHRPLPGKPHLGLFLEPAAFGRDRVRAIEEVWGGRPRSEAPLPEGIDRYMQAHTGQTLIVAGHVVKKGFEIEIRPGKTYLIDIETLTAKAEQHGVQLFPVGCETGRAGAPVGFLHPISTDQLLDFMRGFPSKDPRYGDVMAEYSQVGEFLFNPAAVGGRMELQVIPLLCISLPNRNGAGPLRRNTPNRHDPHSPRCKG